MKLITIAVTISILTIASCGQQENDLIIALHSWESNDNQRRTSVDENSRWDVLYSKERSLLDVDDDMRLMSAIYVVASSNRYTEDEMRSDEEKQAEHHKLEQSKQYLADLHGLFLYPLQKNEYEEGFMCPDLIMIRDGDYVRFITESDLSSCRSERRGSRVFKFAPTRGYPALLRWENYRAFGY